jgi:four helix bundle protein
MTEEEKSTVNYLKLNDITAYKTAFDLSNYIWDIIERWDYFPKETVGKQFVRAADSISSNIAEGFGRYGKKDKIKFYRYSIGSLKESLDWNEKSKKRNLIENEEYSKLLNTLQLLPKEIYALINYTNEKLKV